MIKLHAQEEDIYKKKQWAKKSQGPLTFFHPLFFRPFRLSLAPLSAPGSPRMTEKWGHLTF